MLNPVLDGFENKEITLRNNMNVAVGKAVGFKNAYTSCVPADGDHFCGVCTSKRGIYVTVLMSGFTTVSYSGTAPVVGYNKLVGDGTGKVKVDDNGRHILVTNVDTTKQTIDIIL